jgi:hypothetical protein
LEAPHQTGILIDPFQFLRRNRTLSTRRHLANFPSTRVKLATNDARPSCRYNSNKIEPFSVRRKRFGAFTAFANVLLNTLFESENQVKAQVEIHKKKRIEKIKKTCKITG